MAKTNFEKLRVYQLAEKLADKIWEIVVKWDYFAKNTVGMQMVTAADGSVRISPRALVAEAYKTTEGSSR